jgi:hypothetical protein
MAPCDRLDTKWLSKPKESQQTVGHNRVARWYIFIPENTNFNIFWRTSGWKICIGHSDILRIFGIF